MIAKVLEMWERLSKNTENTVEVPKVSFPVDEEYLLFMDDIKL